MTGRVLLRTGMISIIIPLFNERENVAHYPSDLFPVIDEIGRRTGTIFEFIFVDDGSRDDTVERLIEVTNPRPGVQILRHPENRGMGEALKTGLAACHGDEVITMDADLTFRPADVERLIEGYRATGADCVSGSPYLGRDLMDEVSLFRLATSRTVNFLYRLLLGSGITCVSPIFRLYRRSVLAEMNITSRNFEINVEIISKLLFSGRRVVEVPVPLHTRRYGTSKINLRKEIRNYLVLFFRIFRIKYLRREWF